ncbi:hypothetical protein DPMN_041417 [Dreissena polymorpha]|uniref:Uncharacterized protein n=1 Tax=Dreissena polymorpha TaxID=45954 RepID=A0A9D4CX67_DREPO|nr:hypothetical protein DPMN_041417 [Dreissena polymorpha]
MSQDRVVALLQEACSLYWETTQVETILVQTLVRPTITQSVRRFLHPIVPVGREGKGATYGTRLVDMDPQVFLLVQELSG